MFLASIASRGLASLPAMEGQLWKKAAGHGLAPHSMGRPATQEGLLLAHRLVPQGSTGQPAMGRSGTEEGTLLSGILR